MAATPEQKFNAAVKVIRGLPKNGTFQPSHELMLKFYAYFKQATEGPNTAPKPGIWNYVSRRKWEAWSELGQMDRETAMLLYIEELKNVSKHVRDTLYPPEIVETMPQTEQVTEFVDTLGTFYELVEEGTSELPMSSEGASDYSSVSKLDHSATLAEMLKINNNDSKKGEGEESGEPRCIFNSASTGVTTNGHGDGDENSDDAKEEEEEEVEEEDEEAGEVMKREEEEQEEEGQKEDHRKTDSGSDTDEFCDSSDQMLQALNEVAQLQAVVPKNTSTPVDRGMKRETRVRFAPHMHTVHHHHAYTDDYVVREEKGGARGDDDTSFLLHHLSSSPVQMLSDRLALGTSAAGWPVLPERVVEMLTDHLSESLTVNNSFSSLVNQEGTIGVAAREFFSVGVDGEDTVEDEEENALWEYHSDCDSSPLSRFDPLSSRGGGSAGGQEAGHTQATGECSQSAGPRGTSSGGAEGGSDSRSTGSGSKGGSRHGHVPAGSGGRDFKGGGDGDRGQGSLDEQILLALLRMRQDMTNISNRLAALEMHVHRQWQEEQARKASKSWWSFGGMSKSAVFLLVVWPFFAPIIVNLICRRRHNGPS